MTVTTVTQATLRALSTDELCAEVVRRGLVVVDAKKGVAYARRFWGKQLGCVNKDGYVVCTLHLDGQRKQVKMHRLIWISVHGIPPRGLMPDHKNRVKTDNRIGNLHLVTSAGNAENRRRYDGEANPACRISREMARQIRRLHSDGRRRNGLGYPALARRFGVSASLIGKICRNELWTEESQA